jgi:diguanylate cyclase (GGDEF)-like protein
MRRALPRSSEETLLPAEARERDSAVAGDLVADLYRRCRMTSVLIVAFWFVLRKVLGPASDHGTAIDWLLDSVLALIVVRWGVVLILARAGSVRRRFWIFAALTASIGVGFGILNLMASSEVDTVQFVMLATCQAAMTSIALISLAGSGSVYLLFTLPNLGVLVALAFHSPLSESRDVFAMMLVLYLSCLLVMEWYVHSSLEESFRLRRRLTGMTLRDPLTGLWNRRYVAEFMESEALLAARTGRVRRAGNSNAAPYRFAVILVDLDHFKAINDGRGHEAGDAVLAGAGRVLREAMRGEDIAARWGGEEFVVIARNVADGSIGLAERIRRGMAAARFDAGSGPAIAVTCSVGQAIFPFSGSQPPAANWEDVLALADRCLYFAKNHGRNATVAIVPGKNFDALSDLSELLETDLEEARGRGWIRFLSETDSEAALPQAS